MNDKDKEAFENLWDEEIIQKLQAENESYKIAYKSNQEAALMSAILSDKNRCLEAENKKLREALDFYAEPWERGEWEGDLLVRKIGSYDQFIEVHSIAREALKEVGDK